MKKIFLIITGLLLLAGQPAIAHTPQCLFGYTDQQWQQVIDGEKPWPDELFPISSWSAAEKKALPESFWKQLAANERRWPFHIMEQQRIYQQEYGKDIRNRYELYFAEKKAAKTKDPCITKKKTLDRLTDLAALEAGSFKNLQGTPLKQIRLVAYRMGKLRSIPFDILEFTPDGRVVLPAGPESNPDEGDAVFNNRDRLIFMAADAGDQLSEKYLNDNLPGCRAIETIHIENDDEHGWVYAVSSDKMERCPIDALRFFPETGTTFTPFVFNQCECRQEKGEIASTLGLRTWASCPNVGGVPLDSHNRLHINTAINFKVGRILENDEDFNLRWRAWYDGNIIFYARTTWKMKTPFGIGAPTVFADILATPLSLLCYPSFYTPFDPWLFIRKVEIAIGEDLNRTVVEDPQLSTSTRLVTSEKTKGVLIGKSGCCNSEQADWILQTGRFGTVCVRTAYDDYLTDKGELELQWQDTDKYVGYYLNSLIFNEFEQRQQHFYVEWDVVPWFWNSDPDKYNWHNLELILKHRDDPLEYSVNGSKGQTMPRNLHVPDIAALIGHYQY